MRKPMFRVPAKSDAFEAREYARNKMERSNQFGEEFIARFENTYRDFWGVSGNTQPVYNELGNVVLNEDGTQKVKFIGNGSVHDSVEMQEILDVIGHDQVILMLQRAGAWVQFLESQYPGALPTQYHTAAFDLAIDPSGTVTVGALNATWSKPA